MIVLENGVRLGDEFMEYSGQSGMMDPPHRVRKGDVARAFKSGSDLSNVPCYCVICAREWEQGYTGASWPVSRIDGEIAIGCCIFTPEMIAIVRKWAGVE